MKAAIIHENGPRTSCATRTSPTPSAPTVVCYRRRGDQHRGWDLLARAESPPPSVPHIVGYLAAGTVVEVGAGSRIVRSAIGS